MRATKTVHPSLVLRRAARRQPWPSLRVALREAAVLQVATLGRCGTSRPKGTAASKGGKPNVDDFFEDGKVFQLTKAFGGRLCLYEAPRSPG